MKVSESWLREWVQTDATTDVIEHELIMSGTELDGVVPVASNFTHVVIGQIKETSQHPDADRLMVCQVDVGESALIQIVTNATVEVDQKVPVARVGASLPGEDGSSFDIKESKLRGVLSQGMFCGGDTLGMGDRGEGLLPIPTDAAVGKNLRDVIDLNDVVLELDATPNRADLLSVAGVSRELGVILESDVTSIEIPTADVTIDDQLSVSIHCEDLCHRYAGRVIKSVNTKAQTPDWITEKLFRSGIRSLSPVVDITNYVMLELGQPMHGFDVSKISKEIIVRNATKDEKLELLDGKMATLREDTMVIADADKALALAGIMGGLDSSVTDQTNDIYLESAFFVPHKIMGKARTYGMHTDSSHRFERGVSPDIQIKAIERATQLILDICGGEVGPITDIKTNDLVTERIPIDFKRSNTKRHLGIEVDDERVEDILTRLGCSFDRTSDTESEGWMITPPIFRFDLATKEDVVEEIARIYGYNNIPSRLRPMAPMISTLPETSIKKETLKDLLVSQGYSEAVTYSFVKPSLETLLSPDQEQLVLSNPISDDLSVMRSSLWSGLIPALEKNLKHQQTRVRLFETGLSFIKKGETIEQREKIAGVITGNLYPDHWDVNNKKVDFFDIKGNVEMLLDLASVNSFEFVPTKHEVLHPGQSAAIMLNDNLVGYCGAIHPTVKKALDLTQDTFVFELDLEAVLEKNIPSYQQVSSFPSVKRDLAILIDESVSNKQLETEIMQLALDDMIEYTIFDVYSGEGIEKGKKSIAFSLIFQAFSRTLEESDVNSSIDRLIKHLSVTLNAELR